MVRNIAKNPDALNVHSTTVNAIPLNFHDNFRGTILSDSFIHEAKFSSIAAI